MEQLAEEFRQPKLFEVVSRFLKATLRNQALIHVEDAHLMDGASSELFSYLLRETADRPWLFTVTRRDETTGFVAPDHERARSIHLRAARARRCRGALEAATEDEPLLPHVVALVADRSGGNPQFALDLAQVVATGGMLPESIETAAMARIDALAPADRALVRRASVLGISFARRFLPRSSRRTRPIPTTRRGIASASSSRTRATASRGSGARWCATRRTPGLPFRTRRSLHARVAARFEAEYNPEETGGLLSLHYFLAGSFDRAWGYARHAAERAAVAVRPAGGGPAVQARGRRTAPPSRCDAGDDG